MLKNVNNLDEYVCITQDMVKNIAKINIQFNMSTVLALKKLQFFEIEYFNKCNENGAAFIMFEFIAEFPPSKIWNIVGKEIVNMIQYWLEAVRKHLIIRSILWWKFLERLLMSIQKIYSKHTSVINWLVEKTSEGLLDLATRSELGWNQRYQIIQCFNKFCAESTREIRIAKKYKLNIYFERLATLMAGCGDVRLQYTIMETLKRWMLPRGDLNVKREAAVAWFPTALYSKEAVKVFMERDSNGFFKDTRHFLNTHNESSDRVVSVRCQKLAIGNVNVVSAGTRESWLDFNCGSKCISLMLQTTLYRILDVPCSSRCDALVITDDNAIAVRMYRGSNLEVLLLLNITSSVQIYPSKVLENNYDVKAIIGVENNFQRLDNALRTIFDNKYQLMMNKPFANSSLMEENLDTTRSFNYISEEDSRFSNPAEVQRRKQLEETASPITRRSHSSTSTTSLLMLRERLSAFADCPFNNEVRKVSKSPLLRSVTEVIEIEERQSHGPSLVTPILQGTCNNSYTQDPVLQNKKPNIEEHAHSVNVGIPDNAFNGNIEATNIIDLLAKEALQCEPSEYTTKTLYGESDFPKHTVVVNKTGRARKCDKKEYNHTSTKYTTTANEFSSTFIKNNPVVYVNETNKISEATEKKRDTINDRKNIGFGQQSFDNSTGEGFFSQHFAENIHGNLVVSPKLAKSINDSRVNIGDSVILCPPVAVATFNQVTNSDKVGLRKTSSKEVTNSTEGDNQRSPKRNDFKTKTGKGIKLKYTTVGKQTNTYRATNNPSEKMSPPIGKRSATVKSGRNKISKITNKTATDNDLTASINKSRRKLYSTKDGELFNTKTGINVSETEEDSTFSQFKTAGTTSTSYKELQKIRNKASTRQLRNRKSKCPSPKTKDMNTLFDNLKETVENDDQIMTVNTNRLDNGAVYNFTSESDDNDFKKKEVDNKRNSAKKNSNSSSRKRTLRGENKSVSKHTPSYKKLVKSSFNEKKLLKSNCLQSTADERMREAAPDALNTSLIIEFQEDEVRNELEPSHKKPCMIFDLDEKESEIVKALAKKTKKRSESTSGCTKKRKPKTSKLLTSDKTDDRNKTTSPLPGLEIETVQKIADRDDSIKMLEKFENNFPDVSKVTQVVLSASEQVNINPPQQNVIQEFKKAAEQCLFNVNSKRRLRSSTKNNKFMVFETDNWEGSQCDSNASVNEDVVVVVAKADVHVASTESISTVGRCPITAHGASDELPPDVNQLDGTISCRSLEAQDLNERVTCYYDVLTKELNVPSNSNHSQNESENNIRYKIHEKSPTVSVTRLTSKDINKWLSPPRNSLFGSAHSSESSTTRDTRSYRTRNAINKNNSSNDQSSLQRETSSRSDASVGKTRSCAVLANVAENTTTNRRSMISPIDLFEVFHVDGELKSSQDRQTPRYSLRKYAKPSLVIEKVDTSTDRDEPSNMPSVSNTEIHCGSKATSECASFPSSSSVHDWFRRNKQTVRADDADTVKEILSYFLEKLDTTLHEIQHNTSKSLLQMFVELQTELDHLSEEREESHRQTARDILEAVYNIVDNKFASLNQRCKKQDDDLKTFFEKRGREIIRADVKQKCVMVKLLKEDVQTLLDQVSRRNKP